MSDEKLCSAAGKASESEHNIEDCKTQKHGGTWLVGVRSNPIMPVGALRMPASELPPCDLDYEKNRRFFHYFLKIRGIVKKLAIFYTIFLLSTSVQFSPLNAVTRQKSRWLED